MTDYKKDIHPICYTLAGITSGVVCRAVAQPLDVLKIRFQVQDYNKAGQLKYTGIVSATRLIVTKEGVSALWKGHLPAQLLSILYAVGTFNTYEFSRNHFLRLFPKYSEEPFTRFGVDFVCGGLSGIAATFLSQPVDVLRTRLVVQEQKMYSGIFHAVKLMYKENGMRTFYKGVVPSLWMIYPAVGLRFCFYGLFKYSWLKLFKEENHSKISKLLCGAASGVGSKFFLLPFDNIKKRLQVDGLYGSNKYNGMLDCFRTLFREQGISVFYRGTFPTLLKAGVATSIYLFVYEESADYCYRYSIFKSFTSWQT